MQNARSHLTLPTSKTLLFYMKGYGMKKDKILAIRLPETVRAKLQDMADRKGITLTDLVRESLAGLTWEVELERNIEYHRAVIAKLAEVEKFMRKTQKARSKAIVGVETAPRKKEQMELMG